MVTYKDIIIKKFNQLKLLLIETARFTCTSMCSCTLYNLNRLVNATYCSSDAIILNVMHAAIILGLAQTNFITSRTIQVWNYVNISCWIGWFWACIPVSGMSLKTYGSQLTRYQEQCGECHRCLSVCVIMSVVHAAWSSMRQTKQYRLEDHMTHWATLLKIKVWQAKPPNKMQPPLLLQLYLVSTCYITTYTNKHKLSWPRRCT